MTDPRLKICSHPTCVNLFAASQKIAIKKRHVMACNFARQAGGVWWSQMKEDSSIMNKYLQSVQSACGRIHEHRTHWTRVCKCRDACKGGWYDD